jgi:hypothetical protein
MMASSVLHALQEQKKSDWRKKREDFIATLRAAKEAQRHLAAGGSLKDLPPPPPMDTSDYIQCPHCSRRFVFISVIFVVLLYFPFMLNLVYGIRNFSAGENSLYTYLLRTFCSPVQLDRSFKHVNINLYLPSVSLNFWRRLD